MTDSHYDGNRKGSITKEKAVETFNKYYENRANSAIGRFRAKLFDMMYQKKPSKTLTPGEPGSERYLLEEGPRTFDMKGVDSFEEGEEFLIHGEDNSTRYKSKGSTYRKSTDNKDAEIYGPRLNNDDKTLYSSHFKEVYQDRAFLEEDEKGSLNGKSLVEIYWDKYKDGGIKRKNLKLTKDIFSFTGFDDEKNIYTIDSVEKIIYDESGALLNDEDNEIQLEFLIKLNLLTINKDDDYILNKNFTSAKFLEITAQIEDMKDVFYYKLDNGLIVNKKCVPDRNNISLYKLMELLDYELEDIILVKIHNCLEDELSVENMLEPNVNLFKSTTTDINTSEQSLLDDDEQEYSDDNEQEDSDDNEQEDSDDDEQEYSDDNEQEDSDDNEQEDTDEDDEQEDSNEDDEDSSASTLLDKNDDLIQGADDIFSDIFGEEDQEDEDIAIQLNKEQMEVFNKLPEDMRNEPGFQEELSALEL